MKHLHRAQCAAISRNCFNSLIWEDARSDPQHADEFLLTLNGWRKDHGKWICGNHPQPAPAAAQTTEANDD